MPFKGPAQGLYDRQGYPAAGARPHLSGYVVNAGWSQLQANSSGGAILSPNPIETELNRLDGNNPDNLRLKIRMGQAGGGDHPGWLRLAAGHVRMYDPVDTFNWPDGKDIVCWWKTVYLDAYADLCAKLAALYDGHPLILDWVISNNRSFYMEPFIKQIAYRGADGTNTNWPNLQAAGYTKALDQAGHRAGIDAHAVFVDSCSSMAFNGYQYYSPEFPNGTSEGITTSGHTVKTMEYGRRVLGKRFTLGNNGYDNPLKAPTALYTTPGIDAHGAPIYFQTETPKKVNLKAALTQAVDADCCMIELPGSYPYASYQDGTTTKDPADTLSDAEMDTYDADLRANVTQTPVNPPGSLAGTVASSTQIDLTWLAPANTKGLLEIRIYRSGVTTPLKVVPSTIGSVPTSTSVTGLTAGTTYTLTARSFNGEESTDSNPVTRTTSGTPTGDTTPPTMPVITTAAQNASGGVDLAWTASTDDSGIVRYDVERDGTVIFDRRTTLSYTDPTPVVGVVNNYRVVAYDPSNNNTPSEPVAVPVSAITAPVVATGWRRGRRRLWR